MHEILNRNLFFIKEHIGFLKAANNYDILDPATGNILLECREESLGFFTKMLRFTDYKTHTPFDFTLRDSHGERVLRVKRGVSFFLSDVSVLDENDEKIGGFKQKFFSIGGAFNVSNSAGEVICTLKGNWVGWNFRFLGLDGMEYAKVSKKWAGVGKELFTTADNYILEIFDTVPADSPIRQLILATVMCIDMVLKEKSG